jgi:hypothetical protein
VGQTTLAEYVGEFVIHRVHECDALRVGSQPFLRKPQGLTIAIKAQQTDLWKGSESVLGMSAKTERGINQYGARLLQRRRQQGNHTVLQDRYVARRGRHYDQLPITEDKPASTATVRPTARARTATERTIDDDAWDGRRSRPLSVGRVRAIGTPLFCSSGRLRAGLRGRGAAARSRSGL